MFLIFIFYLILIMNNTENGNTDSSVVQIKKSILKNIIKDNKKLKFHNDYVEKMREATMKYVMKIAQENNELKEVMINLSNGFDKLAKKMEEDDPSTDDIESYSDKSESSEEESGSETNTDETDSDSDVEESELTMTEKNITDTTKSLKQKGGIFKSQSDKVQSTSSIFAKRKDATPKYEDDINKSIKSITETGKDKIFIARNEKKNTTEHDSDISSISMTETINTIKNKEIFSETSTIRTPYELLNDKQNKFM